MSQAVELKIAVTTTGSDASATGNTDSEISLIGYLLGFRLQYHADAPATTDVVITSVLPSDYPTQTLLTVTDNEVDIPYRHVQSLVYSDSNASTGRYMLTPLVGHKINVAVSGSDALTDCVIVWAVYMKEKY